jgi:hypothetical protein
MSRSCIATLVLVAFGSVPLGCGGAKSHGSRAATTVRTQAAQQQLRSTAPSQSVAKSVALTREQLIERADPICARVNARLKATSVTTFQEYAVKLPQLATAEQTEAAQLSQLKPPLSMREAWNRIVDSLREVAADTDKVAGYADARNTKSMRAVIERGNTSRERVTKTAARYGFKECSS